MVKTNIRKTASTVPKQISGVLNDLLSQLSIARNYKGWSIVSDWPKIVGESIAAQTEAVKFDEGILFVAVRNDAWRQELSMQKEAILKKIKGLPYGSAIKQIRLIRGRKG